MSKSKKMEAWPKIRKFFNDIHLWAGLISGLIIIVVCLSGTIYVYNTELREMASPHLHEVEVPENGTRLPAKEIIENIAQLAGGKVGSISIPADLSGTYQLNVRKEGDKSRFGTTYYVNPYTGDIVGDSNEETATGTFMSYMFSLHRWLLLDKIEEPIFGELENRKLGSYITGTATILFTLGVITGMIIWFPRKIKSWKQGLKIKWGGSWKRTNHDLHNTLAFYSIIILFLMGVTGPQWSFPWYRTALQKTLGTYEERKGGNDRGGRGSERNKSEAAGNQNGRDQGEKTAVALLPVEAYLSSADLALPYEGDYRVSISEGAPVEISKSRVGFFAPAAGDKITLDASTAKVISQEIFRDKPFNERVAGSIKALHLGNVYGQFSKLLYFISCLIATSLPITGTLIWLNKMKKKPKKKEKKVVVQEAEVLV